MIINCEQCNARYLVASLLLGTDGRKVRCGVCGHVWFQEPIDEAYRRPAEEESGGETGDEGAGTTPSFQDMVNDGNDDHDVPQSIHPIPDDAMLSPLPPKKQGGFERGDWNAVAAAVALVIMTVAAVYALRVPLVAAWPAAALVLDVPVPGEGLIFDQLRARAVPDDRGVYTLTLEGSIINLHARPAALPKVMATLHAADGTVSGDSWIVPVDGGDVMDGESIVNFTTTYPNLPDATGEVNVRFVLR